MTMEGLTVNEVPPTCEASQPHQCAGYGYSSSDSLSFVSTTSSATLQYSAPLAHSSCAEAAAVSKATRESELVDDCIHKVASVSTSSRQSPLVQQSVVMVSASGTAPSPCSADVSHQMSQCSSYHSRCPAPLSSSTSSSSCREATKNTQLEPPKKPLTPYMRFSKSIWFQVKAANPHLSVCQIGATIGRMWRELSEAEKQRHLEEFQQDKIRYDNELKRYMKSTGLRLKELRAMAKSQPKSKNRNRSSSSSQQAGASASVAAGNSQLAAQAAAFMGLPISAGVPMGMLGAAGAMGMLPSHFSQVWPGGQQYAGQQMMGIAASQLQLASQSGSLYSNGYALGTNNSSSTTSKPAMASRDGQMYRYSQNYL